MLLILGSCSSLKTEQELLYENYQKNDLESAIEVISSKKFKDKENRLLYLMEISSIQFYQKKHIESLESLQKAQDLASSLYTKSIRQLILSSVLGEEFKSFYGKIYERSALFHLQILNLFSLYSGEEYYVTQPVSSEGLSDKTKEVKTKKMVVPTEQRVKYLMQARSVVLAWDSFYETLQKESKVSFFTRDYYQQLLSAHIHEEVGSRKDLNIALILYENTLKDFDRLVSLYPSFNLNSELAIKNYLAQQEKASVQLSESAIKLKEFIKYKVLSLTKKISKTRLKRKLKQYKPSEVTIAKLNDGKEYVSLFLFNKVVEPIKEKVVSYNLNRILNKIEDKNVRNLVEVIGISTLTYFTLGPLGLPTYVYNINGESRTYVYSNIGAGNELIKNIGIDIVVPYRDNKYEYPNIKFLKDNVLSERFSLLSSYSEKASLATQEFANRYYSVLGPKVALKYLVAIVGAYTTYNTLNKAENPFASVVALTQYYASTKVISSTYSVDTRSWIGIPSNIQFVSIDKSLLQDINKLTVKLDENDPSNLTLTQNNALFFLHR